MRAANRRLDRTLRPSRVYIVIRALEGIAEGAWMAPYAWFLYRFLQFTPAQIAMLVGVQFIVQLFLEIPTGTWAEEERTRNLVSLAFFCMILYSSLYALLAWIVASHLFSEPGWMVGVAVVAEFLFGVGLAFLSGTLDAWVAEHARVDSSEDPERFEQELKRLNGLRNLFAGIPRAIFALVMFTIVLVNPLRTYVPWLVAMVAYSAAMLVAWRMLHDQFRPTRDDTIWQTLPRLWPLGRRARQVTAQFAHRSLAYLWESATTLTVFSRCAVVQVLFYSTQVFWVVFLTKALDITENSRLDFWHSLPTATRYLPIYAVVWAIGDLCVAIGGSDFSTWPGAKLAASERSPGDQPVTEPPTVRPNTPLAGQEPDEESSGRAEPPRIEASQRAGLWCLIYTLGLTIQIASISKLLRNFEVSGLAVFCIGYALTQLSEGRLRMLLSVLTDRAIVSERATHRSVSSFVTSLVGLIFLVPVGWLVEANVVAGYLYLATTAFLAGMLFQVFPIDEGKLGKLSLDATLRAPKWMIGAHAPLLGFLVALTALFGLITWDPFHSWTRIAGGKVRVEHLRSQSDAPLGALVPVLPVARLGAGDRSEIHRLQLDRWKVSQGLELLGAGPTPSPAPVIHGRIDGLKSALLSEPDGIEDLELVSDDSGIHLYFRLPPGRASTLTVASGAESPFRFNPLGEAPHPSVSAEKPGVLAKSVLQPLPYSVIPATYSNVKHPLPQFGWLALELIVAAFVLVFVCLQSYQHFQRKVGRFPSPRSQLFRTLEELGAAGLRHVDPERELNRHTEQLDSFLGSLSPASMLVLAVLDRSRADPNQHSVWNVPHVAGGGPADPALAAAVCQELVERAKEINPPLPSDDEPFDQLARLDASDACTRQIPGAKAHMAAVHLVERRGTDAVVVALAAAVYLGLEASRYMDPAERQLLTRLAAVGLAQERTATIINNSYDLAHTVTGGLNILRAFLEDLRRHVSTTSPTGPLAEETKACTEMVALQRDRTDEELKYLINPAPSSKHVSLPAALQAECDYFRKILRSRYYGRLRLQLRWTLDEELGLSQGYWFQLRKILRELARNASKYGASESDRDVDLTLDVEEYEGKVVFTMSNSVRVPPPPPTSGMGLPWVRAEVRRLQGEWEGLEVGDDSAVARFWVPRSRFVRIGAEK